MNNIIKLSCAVALGLFATGCGSDSKTASTTPVAATVAATPAAATGTEVEVQLADSGLGKILATGDGRTLYMFMPDSGGTSTCVDECAATWPPLVGPAQPGAGLDAEDFATITRDDGSSQVTFYGHPLYHFVNDTNPGDTTGQGKGGVWWVVDSEGDPVGATPTTDGY